MHACSVAQHLNHYDDVERYVVTKTIRSGWKATNSLSASPAIVGILVNLFPVSCLE